MKMRGIFTDWHEVTKEQASNYVKFLLENITTMRHEEKVEYINKTRLRGVTVQELI